MWRAARSQVWTADLENAIARDAMSSASSSLSRTIRLGYCSVYLLDLIVILRVRVEDNVSYSDSTDLYECFKITQTSSIESPPDKAHD